MRRNELDYLLSTMLDCHKDVSDLIFTVNLSTSRGASEVVRVRTLREGVAQVKQALEIAVTQTKDRHTVKDGATSDKG